MFQNEPADRSVKCHVSFSRLSGISTQSHHRVCGGGPEFYLTSPKIPDRSPGVSARDIACQYISALRIGGTAS
jgi:hypothetical protein